METEAEERRVHDQNEDSAQSDLVEAHGHTRYQRNVCHSKVNVGGGVEWRFPGHRLHNRCR
jgi:hypothetical protein